MFNYMIQPNNIISGTDARRDFFKIFDKVSKHNGPFLVRGRDNKGMVMLDEADYDALVRQRINMAGSQVDILDKKLFLLSDLQHRNLDTFYSIGLPAIQDIFKFFYASLDAACNQKAGDLGFIMIMNLNNKHIPITVENLHQLTANHTLFELLKDTAATLFQTDLTESDFEQKMHYKADELVKTWMDKIQTDSEMTQSVYHGLQLKLAEAPSKTMMI